MWLIDLEGSVRVCKILPEILLFTKDFGIYKKNKNISEDFLKIFYSYSWYFTKYFLLSYNYNVIYMISIINAPH